MKLDLYTHFIKVSDFADRGRHALYLFCKSLVEFEIKNDRRAGFLKEPKRTWAYANKTKTEFRFHINSFFSLKKFLENYGFSEGKDLQIIEHLFDIDNAQKITLVPKPTFHTPNQLQIPILDAVIGGEEHSYTVNLQTGKGKTFISLYLAMKIGYRTLITFKGGYLEQWYSVISKSFEFEDIKRDVRVVRGSKELIKIMKESLNGTFDAKIILVTYRTMSDYFGAFKTDDGEDYPVAPNDFYKTLKVGFRITDEFHQEFYSNYMHELQTHLYKTLNLSATLDSRTNQFKNKMYQLVCPVLKRLKMPYHKYIAVTAVLYSIGPYANIRFKGSRGYSQIVYEDWIYSVKSVKEDYFKMIRDTLYEKFISVRVDRQKALIWCGQVSMCTELRDYLIAEFPELTVTRYTSDDPESNIIDFDICVSTIGSSGTAKDIADLRSVFSTVAIDSQESNEQSLGRLRELVRYPGTTPTFYYFVCEQISKHMEYHQNKSHYFKDKTISMSAYNYPLVLGKQRNMPQYSYNGHR